MDAKDEVQAMLASVVDHLPASSRTREAVQRSADLADISEIATEEGLHELAAALFIAQQMELPGTAQGEHDPLRESADELLREYRGYLSDSSGTAAAIDRGAELEEVAAEAEKEGAKALAASLFEIIQLRWQGGGS